MARRSHHECGAHLRGLKDRTVLLTGGANGIGAAIARRLAEEGCTVGILDVDIAAGEDVAGEINARGHRASFYAVDIADYDAVSRAVESFEASFGPVSFLVNNAGWDRAQNFLDTAPDFWRKVVAINLFGPLNVSHVVLRGMAARGFGRVVNIASDAGRVGSSGEAVYSACKGGDARPRTRRQGRDPQYDLPRPDRYRHSAQLSGRRRGRAHRRRAQTRDPDAAVWRAGRLSGPRRPPFVR
jgi:nucleoside-diphosphate-sugar epimerase